MNSFIFMPIEFISVDFHLIGISPWSRNRMPFHYSPATSTDLGVLNGGFCNSV